ncbi:DNA-directed RNA polymerase subunit A', partial [Candidatus Geothermarchaeota archaeon]
MSERIVGELKGLLEEARRYRISKIKFGVLSPQIIRNMSVVEVTNEAYRDEVGAPTVGGLLDPRFGAPEPGSHCPICGNDRDHCPGHFGHIELSLPVVHVLFADHIYNALRGVCHNCGRIKLDPEKIPVYIKRAEFLKKHLPDRYKAFVKKVIKEASSVERCPH